MTSGHSKRQACELMQISRLALHYQSAGAERDAPVIAAMKRLALQYPRYGYRRIRIVLPVVGTRPARSDRRPLPGHLMISYLYSNFDNVLREAKATAEASSSSRDSVIKLEEGRG